MKYNKPTEEGLKALRMIGSVLLALTLAGCASLGAGRTLRLADGGTTAYVIVKPENSTGVDDYAVERLAEYLKKMTGAEFAVVAPSEVTVGRPAIYVGMSEATRAALGGDPIGELKKQEYVVRSVGPDVFLYGEGVHGNLHAVMDFLEGLGWRWYSVYEKPMVPEWSTLTLTPFERRRGFRFVSREVQPRGGFDFYYQNGLNMGMERRFRKRGREKPPHLVSYMPTENFVHTSFAYVPPTPGTPHAKDFPWLKHRNYFECHPEYFTLWHDGKRVANRQLCFSNPDLRETFTRNVMRHIDVSGENQYVTIDAADSPGPFCACPACRKLEETYQSPGGPYYDYLLELCEGMKKEHPDVMVKMLAYRRSQSQKPPVLSKGETLPDNLIVSFAPIEDCYFADWTHPDEKIQGTYRDLENWGRIAKELWVWIYPNPWGTGEIMPVGNVERLVDTVRMIRGAGGTGVFTDHNGYRERSGWSELQNYLLFQLVRDVDRDPDVVIEEFTTHQYGAAASLVRQYLRELEAGRKAMKTLPDKVTYRSNELDESVFPYLTVENIRRWENLFDEMEKRVVADPERLRNVRLLRRELDFAALWRWNDLAKAFPDEFKDAEAVSERIVVANAGESPSGIKLKPLGEAKRRDFMALIQGGGEEKPLPKAIAAVEPSRIKTFLPSNPSNRPGQAFVKDPDAPFGYAVPVGRPSPPLDVEFYQCHEKAEKKAFLRVEPKDVSPGKYKLFKLGTLEITPVCFIQFGGRHWTQARLGERLYEPGEDNRWDAYVSIKFDGPAYGGEPDETLMPVADRVHYGDSNSDGKNRNLVLVGRIIMVKCE